MKKTLILLFFITTVSHAQNPMNCTEADKKASELIKQMTLKEKVHEMHGHGVARFGLSILFSKKVKPVKAGGCKRLQIPATVFLDGPRGVSLYKGATAFPVTMARGASWDVDLEKRVGEAMAEEIRALGANYSGAVCMNLLRHPAWGRSQETYGEDPFHVGEMASALVEGIQKHQVQACAKHFAANSMENNRFGGSMNMDERTLHEVYLPHFKKVIERGAASVMSAYNKLNGEYCGHSKTLLTDILRHTWGFKGYITSDWQNGLYDAQKGVEAGMNIEMPSGNVYSLRAVKKLLRNGKISEQQIDDLIFPIISTKLLFAQQKDKQEYARSLVGCKEHTDLALEAAEKSAVLLKNENAFLPLDKSIVKRIAVIGSLANSKETGDHGSSRVFPGYVVSALDGVRNYFSGTSVEILTAPVADLESIKTICAKADAVIIAAGTNYTDEGEYIGNGQIRDKQNPNKKNFITRTGILAVGGDRKYLHLHPQDIEVIHAAASVSKNIVVSLAAGSAVTVEDWHHEVPAILQSFYNGMEGGNALARILFGDVNPSGKLPFTVPESENDLPAFNSYEANVDYGYYHGYTLFDKEKKQPRYAFGFGLSYTPFEISELKTLRGGKTCNVSVRVKNTGTKPGAEVVQVYVSFPDAKIHRPEKLLRAFKKVFLKPGEEKIVELAVPENDLRYYNTETKEWVLQKGVYTVRAGNSSADKKMLNSTVTIQ